MRRVSKFMSLVLRHDPQKAHLSLDSQGWTLIQDLLEGLAKNDLQISHQQLLEVVKTNDKKRFVISDDGQYIRAAQGHSIDVDLGYRPQTQPEILFHGTAEKSVPSIKVHGLKPGSRQHVHLSSNVETARTVGQRHGKPIVLKIASKAMHLEGHHFWQSDNGVWLTAAVPCQFIEYDS